MQQCATCRWWDITDYAERKPGWGICTLARSEDGEPTVAETKAVAQDYEGYRAELVVSLVFGCVQHERLPVKAE